MNPRSRSAKRRRRDRKANRLAVRVREALKATDHQYRVKVPLEVKIDDPTQARDLLLDALRRTVELESQVTVVDGGLQVELVLEAGSPHAAKWKALYWLQRAAQKDRTMRWTGRGIGNVEAEPA